MLLKILGWLWVMTGILFLVKPLWLRDRLRKKSYKRIRGILFGAALLLSVLLIKVTWGRHGFAAQFVMVLGIIGILKAFFLLKGKAAASLIEWFVQQPIKIFRIFALAQIMIGAVILVI